VDLSLGCHATPSAKGTKDFEKLGNSEVDKVKCGRKYFEALGVDFQVVIESKDLK
jgi:type III restriction enzyme